MKTEKEIVELSEFNQKRIERCLEMIEKFKGKPAETEWNIRLSESMVKKELLDYILKDSYYEI